MAPKISTLAEFQAAVAKAFAGLHQAGVISSSGLTRDLASCGITASLSGSDSTVNVEIKPDPNMGIPAGVSRSDLTAEALAKIAADNLRKVKRDTWHLIRSRTRNGYWTGEQALSALDALGYSSQDRPAAVTTVQAYVYIPDTDDTDHVSFTLPGEHTAESVKATFKPHLADSPAVKAARTAFPNAVGLPDPSDRVQVSVATTWPDTCEFDTK